MGLFSQLGLLISKNITLRRRQPVTLFVEFLWPILILLIVALIKRATPPLTKGPCYYQPLELPNGDFLSFMKSFVCMLDYKCYDSSRLRQAKNFNNSLSPLYDIVVSKENSFELVSVLLEDLKHALNDVNGLRNEEIVLKIQNGSVSIKDFLNETAEIKQVLLNHGIGVDLSDIILSSKIKIIEVYKTLNISSEIKQKHLCDPFKSMDYLKTSFNLASLVCKIPKRKLIADADYLLKEIDFSFLSNYSDTIVSFFTSSKFNDTIFHLSRYLSTGQSFNSDLDLLGKFSDLSEITQVSQNGLKLLDLIKNNDQQILFGKKLIQDFSPVFDTINEWNQFETLIDFALVMNKVIDKLDKLFTVKSVFGPGLADVYQLSLSSNLYISRYELERTNLNFKKTFEFILKLKTNGSNEPVCVSPGLTGIFNRDFPDDIKSNLDYQLQKYCQFNTKLTDQFANKLLAQFDLKNILQILQYGSVENDIEHLLNLGDKIKNLNFQQINSQQAEKFIQTFKSINAGLEFLEKSINDSKKFDLKNVYSFGKKLIQILAPDFISTQGWFYADLFLPMVLPTLETPSLRRRRSLETEYELLKHFNQFIIKDVSNTDNLTEESNITVNDRLSQAVGGPVNLMDLASLIGLNLPGEKTSTTTTRSFSGFSLDSILGSSGNSLASLTPLLGLLPLEQGFISSLPQIMGLVQSVSNFKLPSSKSADPKLILKEWSSLVADLRTQSLSLVQILTNVGQIRQEDSKIIQSVLSANLETISSPDVIGKLVLACQGVNIWAAIQPDKVEMRNSVSSLSLIIDLANLGLNTTLQLIDDDGSVFECSNDPLMDYYSLTKRLNLIDQVSKLKQLMLNQQTLNSRGPNPRIDCLKIDTLYSKILKLQKAFEKDTSGVIKKKFDCFKNSLFLPFKSILNSLRNIFNIASNNSDEITILSTQMNKFLDIVKLFSLFSNVFQSDPENTSSRTIGIFSLMENPDLLTSLAETLPQMMLDLKNMSSSLTSLQRMQSSLDLNSFQDLNNMFSVLDSVKSYENEIEDASQRLSIFWKKYFNVLSKTSYSSSISDVQKGIESLSDLVKFFNKNFNGVKISNLFSNFTKINEYLKSFGFSERDSQEIGDSKIFYSPQKIYNFYTKTQQTLCNPVKLEEFLTQNNSNYIEIESGKIKQFWVSISRVLCSVNKTSISTISKSFVKHFHLNKNVREIFANDSSIIQKLSRNSSIFTNLNLSTFKLLNSNTITKLNGLFRVFTPNSSILDLPNLFGKVLCGPDFSLKIENYGYSIKPASISLPFSSSAFPTTTSTTTSTTPTLTFERSSNIANGKEFKVQTPCG